MHAAETSPPAATGARNGFCPLDRRARKGHRGLAQQPALPAPSSTRSLRPKNGSWWLRHRSEHPSRSLRAQGGPQQRALAWFAGKANSFHPAKAPVPHRRRARPAWADVQRETLSNWHGGRGLEGRRGWDWGTGGCANQTAPGTGKGLPGPGGEWGRPCPGEPGAAMFLAQEYGVAT